MVLNNRLGRLPDPTAHLLGSLRGRLQRGLSVRGGTLEEQLVLGVVRELAEGIGPRLGGSEASHRARDYLAELLAGMGFDVHLQPFTYVGWEYERPPEISSSPPSRSSSSPRPWRLPKPRRDARGRGLGGRRSFRRSRECSSSSVSPWARRASAGPPSSSRRMRIPRSPSPARRPRSWSPRSTSRAPRASRSRSSSRRGRRCACGFAPSGGTSPGSRTRTSSRGFPANSTRGS